MADNNEKLVPDDTDEHNLAEREAEAIRLFDPETSLAEMIYCFD